MNAFLKGKRILTSNDERIAGKDDLTMKAITVVWLK